MQGLRRLVGYAHNPVVMAVLLGLGIFVMTSVFAETSRGRINMMQVAAAVFALAMLTLRHRRPAPSRPASSTGVFFGLAAAFVVAGVAWGDTLTHYFVNDDFGHVYQARHVSWTNLWQPLVDAQAPAFLRPLGLASLYLDYHVWGDWMPGYHLSNLLLHLAGTAGVFLLCEHAGMLRGLAAPASMIYAALPVQAEAISWYGARFDLLASALIIWSVVLYLRFRQRGGPSNYVGSIACGILAMFAKENAYTLPFLLLISELFLTRERRTRWIWPFGFVSASVFLIRTATLGGMGGYTSESGVSSVLDLGFETVQGLGQRAPAISFLGFNWDQPGPILWTASMIAGFLVALAFLARSDPRRRSVAMYAFAWILIAAAPAHPLLLIGPSLTNSRVLYLGTVGVALMIAAAVSALDSRRLTTTVTTAVVVLMVMAARHNVAAWRFTSGLARDFLEELQAREPAPPANAQFVFHDLPNQIRGVFFFQVGVNEAVKLAYEREDLQAFRSDYFSSDPDEAIHFRWVNGPDRLIERR